LVEGLERPLLVAKVFDRVTLSAGTVKSRIFGVVVPPADQAPSVLADDEVLRLLNAAKARVKRVPVAETDPEALELALTGGVDCLQQALPSLGLPFKHPDLQPLGLLWPAPPKPKGVPADT
jgi:hypothetical protein